MNRFNRITAIFIQLQSRRTVTAKDIADRFGISLRTVYRDMRSLEEAGVPLVGEAGAGYSLLDGYRLPPIMFTKEEALSFVAAEKLMEKFTDYSLNSQYRSAMFKIKAVLKSSEKELLEEAESQIAVVKNNVIPSSRNISLEMILSGIAEKRLLHVQYFANHSQQHTERDVEPVGIYFLAGHWHLIGWCCLRKDYRDFRIDRMASLSITERRFQKEHPALQTFIHEIAQEKEMQRVVIHFQKDRMRFMGDQKYYNGFVSQKEVGDMMEMTFLSASLEGFARWYIMFADSAEIVEPKALRHLVIGMANQALQRLGSG